MKLVEAGLNPEDSPELEAIELPEGGAHASSQENRLFEFVVEPENSHSLDFIICLFLPKLLRFLFAGGSRDSVMADIESDQCHICKIQGNLKLEL